MMFQDEDDETAYRALVVLTDGYPNGIGSTHGQTRDSVGWSEPWREWRGPVPHSTTDVKNESVDIASRCGRTTRSIPGSSVLSQTTSSWRT